MTVMLTTTNLCALCAAFALSAGLIFAGPAFAQVSEEVRRACERKAIDVRPIMNGPQTEAFIANCIADATATPGTSSGKKKSGNY